MDIVKRTERSERTKRSKIFYLTERFLYDPQDVHARCGNTDALQDLHTPVEIALSASCERRLRPRVVDLRWAGTGIEGKFVDGRWKMVSSIFTFREHTNYQLPTTNYIVVSS